MKIPEKVTEQELARRKDIKRSGFGSEFWRLMKDLWRDDCEAIYKAMSQCDNEKELFRLQGQLVALQKIIAEDANFLKS